MGNTYKIDQSDVLRVTHGEKSQVWHQMISE